MPVTEDLLQHLYREKFVEIRGLISYGNNRYGCLIAAGSARSSS